MAEPDPWKKIEAHSEIISEALERSMDAFAEHIADQVDANGLPQMGASEGTLAATMLTAHAARAIREHSKELVFLTRLLIAVSAALCVLTTILLWRTFA
jgi:hypothetical protein